MMDAQITARRKSAKFPVVRVVPRITYFQRREAGGLVRTRMAMAGAEHIVKVRLQGSGASNRHIGPNTFMVRDKQIKIKLNKFQYRLGLLPDWDYKAALAGTNAAGDPLQFNAWLMLTVQRRRRERTTVIPIQRLGPANVREFRVKLLLDDGSEVPAGPGGERPVVRLGGYGESTVDAGNVYTFTDVPKSLFIVDVVQNSLPSGFRLPPRDQRKPDLTDNNLAQPFVITLVKKQP